MSADTKILFVCDSLLRFWNGEMYFCLCLTIFVCGVFFVRITITASVSADVVEIHKYTNQSTYIYLWTKISLVFLCPLVEFIYEERDSIGKIFMTFHVVCSILSYRISLILLRKLYSNYFIWRIRQPGMKSPPLTFLNVVHPSVAPCAISSSAMYLLSHIRFGTGLTSPIFL